jgi:FtsH-binding integral membrane protein
MNFTPISALVLFPVMLVLLDLGHRFRLRHERLSESSAIEGAVFALFGLLLAFTFSGAVSRYDAHRQLVVEEANDIGTAYLRLDLLPAQAQPALRQLFRDYTTSRLHLYDGVFDELSPVTQRLQRKIWQQSVTAVSSPAASPDAAKLLLPAINAMIDITATRQNAFYMHPPAIVFLLLFAFSCGCAFLAGYSMAGTARNWLHIVTLAVAVTLTIYATLEIEYPRQGLLRLTGTDQVLLQLRSTMAPQ